MNNETDNERYWVSIGNWNKPPEDPDGENIRLYYDTQKKLKHLFGAPIPESFKTGDREEAIRIARQANKIIRGAFDADFVRITIQPYCVACGYLGRFRDEYCPSCGTELEPSKDIGFEKAESSE